MLTSDWHWSPYKIIAGEIGREISTYELFDGQDKFNAKSFEQSLSELTKTQEQTLIIVNTPAHNPTGYTFTLEDWDKLLAAVKKFPDKKIVLLVDIAYLDFAGDAGEYRRFFKNSKTRLPICCRLLLSLLQRDILCMGCGWAR